jgi:mycoredoxin
MPQVILDTTSTRSDRRRTKPFLRARGVEFREMNIEADPEAEATVLRANGGRPRVPTISLVGRFSAGSPFDPHRLAVALRVRLDPSV